jgi:tripartite-type tricarboxylate transporter receptor subunit TctC
MKKVILLGLALLTSWNMTSSYAQSNYPNKPIKIIVPYGAGGSTDVLTRMIAQKLTEKLGTSVVVENKPGANAMIGTELVAGSPNDGYTLLAASSGNAANPALMGAKGQIFPGNFVPIVGLASTPNAISVNPQTPFKTLQDIVAASKKKPDSLSYAHAGTGSLQHIVGEHFKITANIKMVDIPYKGGGPASADVLAGQVPVLVSGLTASINLINSGRLRALAVTSEKRSPNLPNVPTVAESGFPGFNSVFWVALYAPAGTPAAITQKLNADVNEILSRPDVIQQLSLQAAEAFGGTPQSLDAFVKKDVQNFSEIIKTANIKAE